MDNALSPKLAVVLAGMGHEAIHVRDLGVARAKDTEIFDFAAKPDRVVVSADTDFGTLLALRNVPKPSVVLWRRQSPRRAVEQAAVLRGASKSPAGCDAQEGPAFLFQWKPPQSHTALPGRSGSWAATPGKAACYRGVA